MGSRAANATIAPTPGAAWEIYRVPCGHSAVVSVAAFNAGSGDDSIDLAIGDAEQGLGAVREEQWIVRDTPIAARSKMALLDGVQLGCCQAIFARSRGPGEGWSVAGPAGGDIAGAEPSRAAGRGAVSFVLSGREFIDSASSGESSGGGCS